MAFLSIYYIYLYNLVPGIYIQYTWHFSLHVYLYNLVPGMYIYSIYVSSSICNRTPSTDGARGPGALSPGAAPRWGGTISVSLYIFTPPPDMYL